MLQITQIIPAPEGLQAVYTDREYNEHATRVICLALVGYKGTLGIVPITTFNFNGSTPGYVHEEQLEFYDFVKFEEF